MVDYHHIQVLIWWKVIIWCRSTIIFYVIARAMACRPVRVQTWECKDLIWTFHVHIPFGDILCFTEQWSWRLCPHSLWQVWPPWPWPRPPSAPPSIFFSKGRFSHLQAPTAAATLLLDPSRLRAFTPGWQLQPQGVHVPLLEDGAPEVDGQWSLLGLSGRRQQRGDFELQSLKEVVKAQGKN